jgi:hypothetical protein
MRARRLVNENRGERECVCEMTSSSRSFSCSLAQARALSARFRERERERERDVSLLFFSALLNEILEEIRKKNVRNETREHNFYFVSPREKKTLAWSCEKKKEICICISKSSLFERNARARRHISLRARAQKVTHL